MVLVDNFVHADLHPGNILVKRDSQEKGGKLSLVFIDVGLTTTLDPEDMRNFVELFAAVAQGRGKDAARLMMTRAKYEDGVPCYIDPDGFVSGMSDLISSVNTSSFRLSEVRIGAVLQEVMRLCRTHHVKVDPSFTQLISGIALLEGVGRHT